MGFGFFTYCVAIVFAILVESPLISFEKQLSTFVWQADRETIENPVIKRKKSSAHRSQSFEMSDTTFESKIKRLHQLPQIRKPKSIDCNPNSTHLDRHNKRRRLFSQPSVVIENVEQF